MKERTIIFSAPMVRAIFAGVKTQTRRVVKFKSLEPGLNLLASSMSPGHYFTDVPESGHVLYSRGAGGCWNQRTERAYCPYGNVGDRLWVRESIYDRADYALIGKYHSTRFLYVADGEKSGWKARSPIHMPRIASRLTLEITGIRVERLLAITEAGAIAEGVQVCGEFPADLSDRSSFLRRWNEINAKRGHTWETNPWVWVIEFKRIGA